MLFNSGISLGPGELQQLLDRFDRDGDGTINYEEFVQFAALSPEEMDEMAGQLFALFEASASRGDDPANHFELFDLSKTGEISRWEFREALREIGAHMRETDARALMDRFDRRKDGRISYRAFLAFVHDRGALLSQNKDSKLPGSTPRWHVHGLAGQSIHNPQMLNAGFGITNSFATPIGYNATPIDFRNPHVSSPHPSLLSPVNVDQWLHNAATPIEREKFKDIMRSMTKYTQSVQTPLQPKRFNFSIPSTPQPMVTPIIANSRAFGVSNASISQIHDQTKQSSTSQSYGTIPMTPLADQNSWVCQFCSFRQSTQNDICEICGNQNPAMPVKLGNVWFCPICSHSNPASIISCNMCGLKRTGQENISNTDEFKKEIIPNTELDSQQTKNKPSLWIEIPEHSNSNQERSTIDHDLLWKA